ncbi:hypothetical protein ABEB36_001971 [Hypothenemus hampei]|uniref:Fibrobacter succinogenes major paralogous domain-containing protein n=1 Tax=Hypothenemus hampei TaxID=57062 RepID=A0ABD1FGB6_HYPHA
MEFFGLTQYGFSNPVKDMIREDYKEPKSPNHQINSTKSFSEKIRELDCYIGTADGYAYGSNDRLNRMRRKYLWKPIGPNDIYKYPGTNSMNYGWWNYDSSLNPEENWFRPRITYSITTSEMSRFINNCLSIDKYFKL